MGDLFAAFGINWKLFTIQAVNFGVLLLALWYFLYTPVLSMIDERKKKIEDGVKSAEEAQKKLADIESQKDSVIADARKNAGEIVAHAKIKATEDAAILRTEAEARAESIVADAQARAHEESEKARRALQDDIAKSALLAAEKILQDKSIAV